jgi:hypothetical protein
LIPILRDYLRRRDVALLRQVNGIGDNISTPILVAYRSQIARSKVSAINDASATYGPAHDTGPFIHSCCLVTVVVELKFLKVGGSESTSRLASSRFAISTSDVHQNHDIAFKLRKMFSSRVLRTPVVRRSICSGIRAYSAAYTPGASPTAQQPQAYTPIPLIFETIVS